MNPPKELNPAAEAPLRGESHAASTRYAVAVASVVLATLVRLALDPYLGNAHESATYDIAVALIAWWAGWRPALVVVILGYLAADWFFVPPRHSFLFVEDFAHVIELLMFFLVTGTIIALITFLQKAEKTARANAHVAVSKQGELEVEIQRRKQAEEALTKSHHELEGLVRERTAKLQETVQELEHFSYALVHDMRAPLRAIQSFADLLEEECLGSQQTQARDYLRRMKTASYRMDLLITDSLQYTKVVSGDVKLGPVEISPLLRGIVESYPNLQPPGAEITLNLNQVKVLGNEASLTECFSNLLGNAVKFVPQGIQPRVRVWAEEKEALVRIWVEDNGIGVPREAQDRIFGMFQRLHGGNEYPGTGIGLALVRKVVQRMRGRVGVESEEGKGSRFWVELHSVDVTASP